MPQRVLNGFSLQHQQQVQQQACAFTARLAAVFVSDIIHTHEGSAAYVELQ
jgi:hypothetical protein